VDKRRSATALDVLDTQPRKKRYVARNQWQNAGGKETQHASSECNTKPEVGRHFGNAASIAARTFAAPSGNAPGFLNNSLPSGEIR